MRKLFKDKSTFEFTNSHNFLYDEAENVWDMIDKVELENDRINQEEMDGGQVVVTKKNKRGEIFVAKLVTFPVSLETDWDKELDMFFSKKHIEFDESILYQEYELDEKDSQEVNVKPSDENVPEMPEDMKALLAAQKATSNPTKSEVEKPQVEEVAPDDDQDSDKDTEIEELRAEKEELKRQLAEKNVKHEAVVTSEKESIAEEDLTTSITTTPIIESPIGSNIEVDSLVVDFKQSIENRLINYVNNEQKKIDDEIQKLDKRDQIPGTVTKIYRAKEDDQIKKIKIEVAKTVELETAAEDKRHKEALENIKSKNNDIQKQGIEEVRIKVDELIKSNIESETAKQTEQLNNILQGKKNELELRKRELNEGLTSNFENALGSFNDSHEKVIEHVEEKRTSTNNVVKMHA